MKKCFCILAGLLLIVSAFPLSAAGAAPARLFEIYGSGMLFRQNDPVTLAGTAAPGAEITAVLRDDAGNEIARGSASARADGVFAVSFPAPAGGFRAYTVTLSADGKTFQTLSDVAFGEQWLAFGQSNMAYAYARSRGYVPPAQAGEAGRWVRILLTPSVPADPGAEALIPALPRQDIPGSVWVNASSSAAARCSAVAYRFALELTAALGMPVGIVNIPLGGSSIVSWLSRETIENDPALLAALRAEGRYRPLQSWDEAHMDAAHDMTALYNLRLAPLRDLRFSGAIWYQGETEVFYGWEKGRYAHAFDLLQDSCTALFRRAEDLPIVFTHLASYAYGDNLRLVERNLELTEMQAARPASRALVSGADVPPDYAAELGAIHPMDKAHIGQRMAFAAEGLVYGLRQDYTLPTVKSGEPANGGMTLTFEHAGDGLVCSGKTLCGFSLAGENGVFVGAKAEITGRDTVFVHAEAVPSPRAAAYALALSNDNANLYASENGEKTLPAAPFLVGDAPEALRWQRNGWTNCDAPALWHSLTRTERSGFYPAWTACGAAASFLPEAAFAGENGLRLAGVACGFFPSIAAVPVLGSRGEAPLPFSDNNNDWSAYGTLSVMLRNNGPSPVRLTGLRIATVSGAVFYAARQGAGALLPADGKWHRAVFDLNALSLAGGGLGAVFPSRALGAVRDARFTFAAAGGFCLDLDEAAFAPNPESFRSTLTGKDESGKMKDESLKDKR